ncbi:MAG: hypothetical protein OXC68_15360, partial [Aestuariivita sp.]|nr:hypothetical protein [Aestuariivita sp.]
LTRVVNKNVAKNSVGLPCIPDRETLTREVRVWQDQRNADTKPVEWRFTADDARIKLKSLYPSIQ